MGNCQPYCCSSLPVQPLAACLHHLLNIIFGRHFLTPLVSVCVHSYNQQHSVKVACALLQVLLTGLQHDPHGPQNPQAQQQPAAYLTMWHPRGLQENAVTDGPRYAWSCRKLNCSSHTAVCHHAATDLHRTKHVATQNCLKRQAVRLLCIITHGSRVERSQLL